MVGNCWNTDGMPHQQFGYWTIVLLLFVCFLVCPNSITLASAMPKPPGPHSLDSGHQKCKLKSPLFPYKLLWGIAVKSWQKPSFCIVITNPFLHTSQSDLYSKHLVETTADSANDLLWLPNLLVTLHSLWSVCHLLFLIVLLSFISVSLFPFLLKFIFVSCNEHLLNSDCFRQRLMHKALKNLLFLFSSWGRLSHI